MAKDEEVIVEIWGMGPVGSTSIPQPGDVAGNQGAASGDRLPWR
jgi:hypothetical protein